MAKQVTDLTVEGMSCQHCVKSVEKAVGSIKGVDSVKVDLEGKKVTVDYDPSLVKLEAITEAIEDQGYDVQK
jgi:copper chaperone